MEAVANILEYAGGITLLFFQTIRHTFKRPFPLALTVQQIEAIGVRSLTVVNVIALFTGMVLALQTAEAMTRFGAKGYIGVVVALSMLREIGPVFTAIMVGGRVGSGIAAELGSMQVTEQIDAMRVMGAHPVRKLVVPRVIATTLILPMLTVIADILGIFGGLLISIVELKVNAYYYFHTILENITFSDIFSGLGKTFFFGFLIAIIGCYQGLTTSGGTQGVGSSTTRTVVLISIAVLIADFLLTKLFMLL